MADKSNQLGSPSLELSSQPHTIPTDSKGKEDVKHPQDIKRVESMVVEKPDADELAVDTVGAVSDYSDEYFAKLLWKADIWLLPTMWLCYGIQQADKTSLSVQAVFGIREDTHLVGEQFAWLSTIFYLSYMVCEFPGNWLLQKFHTGKFLSVVMIAWGVIVLCVACAKNWAHLMVLRTIQGALECTISPTFMLLTGAWYTKSEHGFRSAIWGTSNAGMNIITGLINYGIGQHAQKHPGGTVRPWMGVSFFLGGLTMVAGVLVYFILGTPREVRWLNEDEKRAAAARVVANQTGSDREKRSEWKWEQCWAAFKDPQTYFFFFVQIINALPNGANTTFSKLVWQSFGFSNLDTLLKGSTPYYCLSICWFLVAGYTTLKKPNFRFVVMCFSLIVAFTGMMGLALLPSDAGKWTRWGLYMIQCFGTLPGMMIWTFLPSNVAGRTKKSVTATVIFVAYCVGNAIGAQIMQSSDAPRYIKGITACGVLYGVEFVSMLCWRFYYIWENKRRAKIVADMGMTEEDSRKFGATSAEADVTDRENIHFRYTY